MSPAEDLTNVTLDGRYRLTRLMGEGGMGQVYEGIHEMLDRKVAVKVLLPRFAYEPKFRERFLREAKAASKVRHPNVVQILDFGDTPNGSVYFAMEYLEGRDLQALLKQEGPLSWARARHLLLQMTSALGAAHERKIIHRDIKPANFFILEARGLQEFVKVLDFGIAKLAADPGNEESSLAQSLTGTGEVFGTAKYMAPEQAYGASDDPRVDVYSLGIVAYEMLTGQVPFTGVSAFHIITRHVNEPPRPPRELVPEIPAEVEAAILRALAKQADERFTSMDELERALVAVPGEPGTATMVPLVNSVPPPSAVPVEAKVQPRPRVSSDMVTAPGQEPGPRVEAQRASEARPLGRGVGSATAVIPTQLRAPSPVTAGGVADSTVPVGLAGVPRLEVPAVGSGAVGLEADSTESRERRLELGSGRFADASIGGTTAPLADAADVGSTTGPEGARSFGSAVLPTSSHAAVPRAEGSRVRGFIVGIVGVLLAGGGLIAAVTLGSDEGGEASAAVSAPSVVSVAEEAEEQLQPPAAPVAAPIEDAPIEDAPIEDASTEDAPAGQRGEASTSDVAAVAVEPKPTKPEPEKRERAKPKTTSSSKPSKSAPPTDGKVRSRLAASMKRKCSKLGSSSGVTVNLLVGAKGHVLSPNTAISGGTPELRKCLAKEISTAKFPTATTTRRVTIPLGW